VPGAEPEEPETEEPETPGPAHADRPQLPLLEPGSDESFPPEWEISRQAHPRGAYLKPDQNLQGIRRVMSTDAFMVVSRAFKPTNPGRDEIAIDFYSPVTTNNRTSRGTAASLVTRYRAKGASPSALDSSYTMEVSRFDRRSPNGRVAWRKSEELQLPQLDCVAAVTPTDLGRWTVRITHNGVVQTEFPICVERPITPLVDGWSRRTAMRMLHLEGAPQAYTSDEGLFYRATYELPKLKKDPKKRKAVQARASWTWRAPDSRWNLARGRYMRFDAFYHCEKDGRWSLTEKVYDSGNPRGKLWQQRTGTTPPATIDLVYGKALPVPGSWSFQEKSFQGRVDSQSIRVHEVTSKVTTLTRGLHPELGRVPFILQVESAEKGWSPKFFHWTLRLVDDAGTTVRKYTGEVAENDRSPLVWTQIWDGKKEDGVQATMGSTLVPVLEIEFQPPTTARLALAAAPTHWYGLENPDYNALFEEGAFHHLGRIHMGSSSTATSWARAASSIPFPWLPLRPAGATCSDCTLRRTPIATSWSRPTSTRSTSERAWPMRRRETRRNLSRVLGRPVDCLRARAWRQRDHLGLRLPLRAVPRPLRHARDHRADWHRASRCQS